MGNTSEENRPPSPDLLPAYNIRRKLGEGTFGCVYQAFRKDNGEAVAIKIIKDPQAATQASSDSLITREVEALIRLRDHPNIIQLQKILKIGEDICMVFEYMDCDLRKFIKSRAFSGVAFSESEIRGYCFQMLSGVYHIHKSGYFHRDLKPSNLLLKEDTHQLKVADLGSARRYSCGRGPCYTDYVTTRNYRAPEVLLFGGHYGLAMDMWAVGAIMAELYALQPIFPGTSSHDQIHKICNVMGTPQRSWPLGYRLAQARGFEFPQSSPGVSLSALIPRASEAAIDLITSLLSWDPLKRPTALKALQHRFFQPLCVPLASRCSNTSTDQPWRDVLPSECQKLGAASLPVVI